MTAFSTVKSTESGRTLGVGEFVSTAGRHAQTVGNILDATGFGDVVGVPVSLIGIATEAGGHVVTGVEHGKIIEGTANAARTTVKRSASATASLVPGAGIALSISSIIGDENGDDVVARAASKVVGKVTDLAEVEGTGGMPNTGPGKTPGSSKSAELS